MGSFVHVGTGIITQGEGGPFSVDMIVVPVPHCQPQGRTVRTRNAAHGALQVLVVVSRDVLHQAPTALECVTTQRPSIQRTAAGNTFAGGVAAGGRHRVVGNAMPAVRMTARQAFSDFTAVRRFSVC